MTDRPGKDELVAMLETMKVADIAEKYEVSRVSVYRWMTKFGIPARGAHNPNGARDQRFDTSLTKAEFATCVAAARRAGVSRAAWFRRAILESSQAELGAQDDA